MAERAEPGGTGDGRRVGRAASPLSGCGRWPHAGRPPSSRRWRASSGTPPAGRPPPPEGGPLRRGALHGWPRPRRGRLLAGAARPHPGAGGARRAGRERARGGERGGAVGRCPCAVKSGGPLVGRPRPGGRPQAGAQDPAGADPPRRPGVLGPDARVVAVPASRCGTRPRAGWPGGPAPPALGDTDGVLLVPRRALDLAGAPSGPFRPGPTCLTSVAIAGHRGSPLFPLSPRDAPWLSGGVTSGGGEQGLGHPAVVPGAKSARLRVTIHSAPASSAAAWHTASSKSWNAPDSAVRTVRSVTAATRSARAGRPGRRGSGRRRPGAGGGRRSS